MKNEKWYSKSVEEVLRILETSKNGLKEDIARKRLEKFGPNEIKEERKIKLHLILLRQFKSYFILILLFASLISFLIGKTIEAITVIVLIFITVALGFIQEYRAEKSMLTLKKLFVPKTRVIRDGIIKEISSKELVKGDIVLLQVGDRVPADCRLIEVFDLRVDESALTGESIPVEKHTKAIKEAVLAEVKNMVFAGTLVTHGRAKAVVVETGSNTELGKIAKIIKEKDVETPLQVKLTQFTKWLGIFILIISASLFYIGILRGEKLFDIFFVVISLAVSAVPETLPTLITVTLALGVYKMAKNNAIVRKLSAVETLGSVTAILADKTGTMTTNEMTVRKIWCNDKFIEVTGLGFNPEGEFYLNKKKIYPHEDVVLTKLLEIGMLCNDSELQPPITLIKPTWSIIGDPTEGSLLVLAKKANIKKVGKRIDEIPFSSERRMMTTIYEMPYGIEAFVKGSKEKILENSTHIYRNGKILKIDEKLRAKILKVGEDMAKEGMRVLALAYKKLAKNYKIDHVEKDLIFVGLVGIIDPPRKEVKKAIQLCKNAGIKVIMLTGDHLLTAISVAKEVGLFKGKGKFLTGEELDKLKDEELEEIVEDVLIYARVTPEQKLRIVKLLKKKGHIVAVTGDGINDAPALKFSDIGIAMGIKGTDVAKEASNMILTDDNFATIVKALEEGRGIYDNIRKYIKYLLTINLSEIFLVSITMLAKLPLPLLPLQILWLNLVTDGPPALALSVDPKDPDIMKRKPRNPKHGILHGMKLFLIAAGCLALLTEVIAFVFTYVNGIMLGLHEAEVLKKARTITFTVGVMFQLFFVFNCRSDNKSFLKAGIFSNKYLILSVLASIILQLMVIYSPLLQTIFETVPLNAFDWLLIILLSSSGLLLHPKVFMR
jgi:Ca2+-transporting ATPase